MTENTSAPTNSFASTTLGMLGPEMVGRIFERAMAEPPGYDEAKVLGMMSRMRDGEWRFDPAPIAVKAHAPVGGGLDAIP